MLNKHSPIEPGLSQAMQEYTVFPCERYAQDRSNKCNGTQDTSMSVLMTTQYWLRCPWIPEFQNILNPHFHSCYSITYVPVDLQGLQIVTQYEESLIDSILCGTSVNTRNTRKCKYRRQDQNNRQRRVLQWTGSNQFIRTWSNTSPSRVNSWDGRWRGRQWIRTWETRTLNHQSVQRTTCGTSTMEIN